tara:strand:- start:1680 stop:2042 length:363 start_codon:yes stop_codon:yes gene_type:complete
MTVNTNLELTNNKETKTFFNQYYTVELSYPANEIDAVVNFFTKRGFEITPAVSVATVILQQAKLENVAVFEVLDTLKGLEEVQISAVVAEVVNLNRPKTSVVGTKSNNQIQSLDHRNILP